MSGKVPSLKPLIARLWPRLRFRTIIFGTLLFTAALPGFGALFLRVYENALVRRTEAELVAQGSALAASAAAVWPGYRAPALTGDVAENATPYRQAVDENPSVVGGRRYHDSFTEIDLRTSKILPPRPPPTVAAAPSPQAVAVASRMAPVFAETKVTTLAAIELLDARGALASGRGSLATLPEVAAALRGRPMSVFRRNGDYRQTYAFEWLSRASNLRLHHARPISVNGRVEGVILLSRSPRALFRGIYEDWGKILLGVALIFALLVVFSAVLVRTVIRPVERLSSATRDMAAGRQALLKRPSLKVVEIDDLYDNFDVMAENIARRTRYLRDFAAAVSHEFKTPLAGIRGAVELLEDHGSSMSGEERARFLANAAADADRLSRLVKRLMELAEADLQLGSADSAAAVGAVLTKVADGFRGPGFAIDIAIPPRLPAARIEPSALEAIASTLMENGKQAGATRMTASATVEESDAIAIAFQDDGPGIAAADRIRIFEPFFTSKREAGGTGMGLAIARSLAEAHGGTLELADCDHGARFVLRLRTGQ